MMSAKPLRCIGRLVKWIRKLVPLETKTKIICNVHNEVLDASSLKILAVTLNMETVNWLGISIVGQAGTNGDGGIFVSNIMKGGAMALDGRIEPNDMIIQVNNTSFENMFNDDAARVLREATKKKGPIKLVVARAFDPPNRSWNFSCGSSSCFDCQHQK